MTDGADRIAFVAHDDELAVEALAVARGSRRRIGADIALVSFEESPLAGHPRAALTSVGFSPRRMGELAGVALREHAVAAGGVLTVPHRLIVRESSTGSSPST
jgi:LacI family transcriptional regulator